jgi:hypothetical protein
VFSRVALIEIDTMRIGVDDAAQVFTREVLPQLQRQEGYSGAAVLVTPEGRGMIITFWHTEDEAAAAADLGTGLLEQYVTLFRAPPGRDHYTVAVADLPAMQAVGR